MGLVHMADPDYDFSVFLGLRGVVVGLLIAILLGLLIKCRYRYCKDIFNQLLYLEKTSGTKQKQYSQNTVTISSTMWQASTTTIVNV